MLDLAHNINGEPFDVPAHATAWRVRRMKAGRGAPELVYDPDGLPLVLPIDAGVEDIRSVVRSAGRYRLDPIDEAHRQLEGAQAAYVYVYPQHLRGLRNSAGPDGIQEGECAPRESSRMNLTENAFIEMAKATTALAQSVVHAMTHQFPAMVASVAELVRAADGAGMPARPPVVLPEARRDDTDDAEDDEDDDDDEYPDAPPAPPPGPDLTTVIAQLLPSVLAAFTQRGSASAPTAPASSASSASSAATAPRASTASTEHTSTASATSDEAARFRAILRALTPQEASLVQGMIVELSAEHASAWKAELSALSVPVAVERIRALLRGEPAPAAPAAPAVPAASEAPAAIPPAAMAHLLAVQAALTPQERALAQALATELAPDDLRAWVTELSALSVPAAIERVRELLHGEPKTSAPAAPSTAGGAA